MHHPPLPQPLSLILLSKLSVQTLHLHIIELTGCLNFLNFYSRVITVLNWIYEQQVVSLQKTLLDLDVLHSSFAMLGEMLLNKGN